ncbi:MAG: 2'-5' RNA ligase family protein, partial [Reyranella sp.]|nr:2'-5' RNA ligase family protein [Reyranella sp.]
MLYVVAWPVLAEADDTALRRLRAQYHPTQADLIGPHFTLVFGAPLEHEATLRAAFEAIDRRPFWFMIKRIARHDLYLFAEPFDGAAELTELHETLDPTPMLGAGAAEPFQPHITLGLFARAAEAEQVARIVERQHLPMHGRVEELALLRREGEK